MTPAAITDAAGQVAKPATAPFSIRPMSLNDIWEVLKLGFEDLRASRTDALTIAIIYPISGIFLASVIVVRAFLPFVFPICAGFALLGPMATLWFAAVSRQRERGDSTAISVFTPERLIAIQRLCSIAIMLFVIWNVTAGIIYGLTLGSSNEDANAPFLSRVWETSAGWTLIIAGCATGALFAVMSLAVFLISFPAVLDRPITAAQAIGISVQAMVRNPFFVLVWGAVVVAGLLGGALPAMLGIVITLPVLGHASWHLYDRMVKWE
jgi:uncharacterized membrane protein